MKEAGSANRNHLGWSDAIIRRCWEERMDSGKFQRYDGSGRPKATAHRERHTQAQRYVDDNLRTVLLPFLLQYPDLIFQQDDAKTTYYRYCYELSYSFSNTSLARHIARYLFNRACLEYYGKVTASAMKC
ncbi:uncharacterized protein TNCV_4913691 [Trichonephila clavipes]|nr:uncharacterized protein TNCV_4913691 [Trichonephila clavipes]